MARDLTNIKYIGDQTERKLRRRLKGSRPTSKIGKKVSVNEAVLNGTVTKSILNAQQQRALAEGTRFFPERSARQDTSTTTTSSGQSDTIRRGDFRIPRDEFQEARNTHDERSIRAQHFDEEKRARVTTDVDQWKSDPNSFDFPGVDTPSSRNPRREEKDQPFVSADSLLRPFESDDDGDDDDSIVPGL